MKFKVLIYFQVCAVLEFQHKNQAAYLQKLMIYSWNYSYQQFLNV